MILAFPRSLLMLLFSLAASPAIAALHLSPQAVVDSVLARSYEARTIHYEMGKAELPLAQALGSYDWQLTSSASYELTRLQTLSGLSNLEDRNRVVSLGVLKNLPSATRFSLKYNRSYQNSISSSFLSTAHPPNQVMDFIDFGVRQDLLSNFFGTQDRSRLRIARREIQRADLRRRENLEALVLEAITLYWRAYVSEAALRESIEAREKYQLLIKAVERKVRLGLAEPPDLSKVRIEYSSQDRRVKSASVRYLSDLEHLLLAAQIPFEKDVRFDVSLDLSTPAEDIMPEVETLRALKGAQMVVENAQDALTVARSAALPGLALFGQISFNGIDRRASRSFSELTGGNYPRYLIGLELSYPLWSEGIKGELRHRLLLEEEARNERARTRELRELELKQAERDVRTNYLVAQMAKETVNRWEKVIVEREQLFQNARVGTAEIIQDYSLYFRAKSDMVAAIADYYFATHRLRAAKDELVP